MMVSLALLQKKVGNSSVYSFNKLFTSVLLVTVLTQLIMDLGGTAQVDVASGVLISKEGRMSSLLV